MSRCTFEQDMYASQIFEHRDKAMQKGQIDRQIKFCMWYKTVNMYVHKSSMYASECVREEWRACVYMHRFTKMYRWRHELLGRISCKTERLSFI